MEDASGPMPREGGRPLPVRLKSVYRRIVGRLVRPALTDWQEVLTAQCRRADEADARVAAVLTRTDLLNRKLDLLIERLERTEARNDRLRDELATLAALRWDHEAVVRRLAQIEDRLIGVNPEESASEPSLRFPGLDRFDEPDGHQAETAPRVQAG